MDEELQEREARRTGGSTVSTVSPKKKIPMADTYGNGGKIVVKTSTKEKGFRMTQDRYLWSALVKNDTRRHKVVGNQLGKEDEA